MDNPGIVVMRWWKLWRPRAFDALADPAAHFAVIGREHDRVIDECVRRRSAASPAGASVSPRERAYAAEDVEHLLPLGEREVFVHDLDPDDDLIRDPADVHVTRDRLPTYAHPILDALDDPAVSAAQFHRSWRAWLETVPTEPRVRSVGPIPPDIDAVIEEFLSGEGDVVLANSETMVVRGTTALAVMPASPTGQVRHLLPLVAASQGKPWATSATLVQFDPPMLVLPLVEADGSDADPTSTAEFVAECGRLGDGQVVVVDGQPVVIDWAAVAWTTSGTHTGLRPRLRPLFLIDIDGCLSPYGNDHGDGFEEALPGIWVHRARAEHLKALAGAYELAWATTWEDSAHTLGRALGWPDLPVIEVSTHFDRRAGFDCGKVPEILRFVGDRPFAWLDDDVTHEDADMLVDWYDCLILRTDPVRGIEDHHLEHLTAWAGGGEVCGPRAF
ncbi:HAD domain-containing protein [Mariniluteicoccus flavus]